MTPYKVDINNDHFMTNVAKRKTMVNADITLETVQLPAPDVLKFRYVSFALTYATCTF